MKYLFIIVPAILAVILSISSKKVAAQPVCNPAYIDNYQNWELCTRLANFFGLRNSLKTYSDDFRPYYRTELPADFKGQILDDYLNGPLPEDLFKGQIPVEILKGQLPAEFLKGQLPADFFKGNRTAKKRQDVEHIFLRFGRRR